MKEVVKYSFNINKPRIIDGRQIIKNIFFVFFSISILRFFLLIVKKIKLRKLVRIDIGSKMAKIETILILKINNRGVPTTRMPTPAIVCKIIRKKSKL